MNEAFGPFFDEASYYASNLFRGKCAYTEAPLDRPLLHLHRPEADALDDERGVSADHYWWMTFWFRNWYNATPEVTARKRNTFSVIGSRAPVPRADRWWDDQRPVRIRRDSGVLLDPCVDFPQMHLRFRSDGYVESWARYDAPWISGAQTMRGDRTIELLGLNSPDLVEGRRLTMTTNSNPGEIDSLDVRLPFLGAARQGLAATVLEAAHMWDVDTVRALAPELVPLLAFEPSGHLREVAEIVLDALPRGHVPLRDAVARAYDLADPTERRRWGPAEQVQAPLEAPYDAPLYSPPYRRVISRNAVLSRVRIRNFQAVDEFDFTFPAAVDSGFAATEGVNKSWAETAGPAARPWWVLLGENGAGKSSVLKAIGLALAGQSLDRLIAESSLQWSDLLRRSARSGQVVLDFNEGSRIELQFDAQEARFIDKGAEFDGFVRGFGAARLREQSDEEDDAHVRLGNLFDALQPVVHSERWLLSISGEDFNTVGVTMARLLDREDEVKDGGKSRGAFLSRRAGEVTIAGEPLRTLSDGYRSVISLACDLMAGAGAGLSDMRNASGIVLLDELGAHLHPRWKMKITRTLRDEFPSMQFVVTTHDPLCLRGLGEREVIGVRRSTESDEPWKAEFERVEQSPSRLRVDQLLTSEFFGLSTTIDPDVDELFQEYYSLLRMREPTPEQHARREALRGSLARYGILGYTARDQLVYQAIDEYLATRNVLSPEERRVGRAQALGRVSQIWHGVASRYDTQDRP